MNCPYCNSRMKAQRSSKVYDGRHDYGKILLCEKWPMCDSYVGCHEKTGEPKGTPANKRLRRLRRRVHLNFDRMWLSAHNKSRARHAAYRYLAKRMQIKPDDCHIAMFRDDDCEKALKILKENLKLGRW